MPNYLDAAHQQRISQLRSTWTARTDWPTWLLLLGTYAAWFSLIHYSALLGRGLTLMLLVAVITFWMSAQHELLHGHPTRWPRLNKVLGYAPLAIWYLYTLYRDSHLLHTSGCVAAPWSLRDCTAGMGGPGRRWHFRLFARQRSGSGAVDGALVL